MLSPFRMYVSQQAKTVGKYAVSRHGCYLPAYSTYYINVPAGAGMRGEARRGGA